MYTAQVSEFYIGLIGDALQEGSMIDWFKHVRDSRPDSMQVEYSYEYYTGNSSKGADDFLSKVYDYIPSNDLLFT